MCLIKHTFRIQAEHQLEESNNSHSVIFLILDKQVQQAALLNLEAQKYM